MLREKRNIELWRMSKVLYQLWDWWRLQGNTAGHNDAPKLKKKKKEKKNSSFCVLVNQGVIWHFYWLSGQPEDFEVKIRVSYSSLDFEGFCCCCCFSM